MTLDNIAKSNLDEWYEIKAKLKIIKAKNSVDVEKPSQPNFRFIVAIPSEFRTGIYPKEITLTGIEKENSWSCNWYDMYESEPSKELVRLAKQVRDLKVSNQHLRDRNDALEKHFTRTKFDEMYESRHKELSEPDCESCMNKIDMKTAILGIDYIYLSEGEIMHLDCASELFSSKCGSCGLYFEYDGEEGCPECAENEHITSMTKEEVKKGLQFNAIKKYLPEELQNKVILTSHSTADGSRKMNFELIEKKRDMFHISLSCMIALVFTTCFVGFFKLLSVVVFKTTMEQHVDLFITIMLILSSLSIIILSFTFSNYRKSLQHNSKSVEEKTI